MTDVLRKGGAAVEKFYVTPDRSLQLRGLAKLLAYLQTCEQSLEHIYAEAGKIHSLQRD